MFFMFLFFFLPSKSHFLTSEYFQISSGKHTHRVRYDWWSIRCYPRHNVCAHTHCQAESSSNEHGDMIIDPPPLPHTCTHTHTRTCTYAHAHASMPTLPHSKRSQCWQQRKMAKWHWTITTHTRTQIAHAHTQFFARNISFASMEFR